MRLWLDHELSGWFEGRVLQIDLAVADRWGRLLAEIGRPVPTIDSLLAATALHHDLRLVTRNAKDFYYPGLEVINPWSSTLQTVGHGIHQPRRRFQHLKLPAWEHLNE